MDGFREEIKVLYEATRIGRADIVKEIIVSLRAKMILDAQASTSSGVAEYENDLVAILSHPRHGDELSPLHIAVENSHTDVIRTLLQAGVSLSHAPSLGPMQDKRPYDMASVAVKKIFEIFLMEQIAIGHVAQVGRLLDGGVSLASTYSGSNDSMLHWAATFADIDIFRELIAHNCDLNLVNSDGRTCLHVLLKSASKNPGIEAERSILLIVRELLSSGLDWQIVDTSGKLAFDYCADKSICSGIQTLLKDLGIDYLIPTENIEQNLLTKQLNNSNVNSLDSDIYDNTINTYNNCSGSNKITNNHFCGSEVNSVKDHNCELPITSGDFEQAMSDDELSSENAAMLSKYYSAPLGSSLSVSSEISLRCLHYFDDDLRQADPNLTPVNETEPSRECVTCRDPLLLWPPPQECVFRGNNGLKNNENSEFLIFKKNQTVEFRLQLVNTRVTPDCPDRWSMDKDYDVMMKCSGIIEFFQKFNINPTLNCIRNVSPLILNSDETMTIVRLAVDPRICVGANRFTIDIGKARAITIVASDFQGLSFAVKDLCQLFILCSHNYIDNGDETVAFQCPTVRIDSKPSKEHRAALINLGKVNVFENISTYSNSALKNNLTYLSNLHFNMIFAIIDTSNIFVTSLTSTAANDLPMLSYCERIRDLNDFSAQQGLDMVPLLKFDRIEKVPFTISNSNILTSFSVTTIGIMLSFDEFLFDTASPNVSDSLSSSIVQEFITNVFAEVSKLEYTAVIIFSGNYLSSHLDLYEIASSVGLTARLLPIDSTIPLKLFSRPLLTSSVMMDRISRAIDYTSTQRSSMVVFPYIFDKDFMYPSIFLKYFAFLFAGLAWNIEKSRNIFSLIQNNEGCSQNDLLYLQRIIENFIFGISSGDKVALTQENANSIASIMSIILTPYQSLNIRSLLNNSVPTNNFSNIPINSNKTSIGNDSNSSTIVLDTQNSLTRTNPVESLSIVEEYLCDLISRNHSKALAFPFLEHKHSFVHLSKLYKKILQNWNWKISFISSTSIDFLSFLGFRAGSKGDPASVAKTAVESKFSLALEFEEVAATIYTYNILLKAIVSGISNYEKAVTSGINAVEPITFVDIINGIQPGIKSDIANSLLEGMKHMCFIWKRRYERISLNLANLTSTRRGKYADSSKSEMSESLESFNFPSNRWRLELFQLASKVHAFSGRAEFKLPMISIFQLLIEKLDLPASILQPFIEMFQ